MRHISVIAHRGARSLAPENTIAAARKALEVGADLWETDIAITADEKLILFHDDSLKRTTNAEEVFPDREPWTFTTFTLEEIRSLDAGSWFVEQDPYGQIAAGAVTPEEAESYRGEKVPTLREALEFTCDNDWMVNLELKRLPPPMDRFPIVETVLAFLWEMGVPLDRIIISSFVHDWLRQVKILQPRLTVQALVGFYRDRPIDWENQHGFETYNTRNTITTPEQVRELVAEGRRINIFTVDDVETARKYIKAGVSGLFTDFPQWLVGLRDEEQKQSIGGNS